MSRGSWGVFFLGAFIGFQLKTQDTGRDLRVQLQSIPKTSWRPCFTQPFLNPRVLDLQSAEAGKSPRDHQNHTIP